MSCEVADGFLSIVSLHSITDSEQSDDTTLYESEFQQSDDTTLYESDIQQSENQAHFEANFGLIKEKSDADDVQIDPNVLAGKVLPPSRY